MKTLTVKQVARVLGKTPKTISQVYARNGLLPPIPRTVGQGKTMLFDSVNVQRFCDNEDLAEFLVLCRWGWLIGRDGDIKRAGGYFGKWSRQGKPVFKPWSEFFSFHSYFDSEGNFIRRAPNGWRSVPPLLYAWAQSAAKVLTRRECECLCAVYIASVDSKPEYTEASFYAVSRDWPSIAAKRNSLSGADLEAFDIGLRGLGLCEVGPGDRYEGPLRQFVKKWFPEEKHGGMFRRLCAWVVMENKQQRHVGQFPKGAAVGRVLRIERAQAGQLVKRTLRKLRASGIQNGLYDAPSLKHDESTPADEDDYIGQEIERIMRRGVPRAAGN